MAARSARVFCPKRHFGSTAAPECQAGPFEDVVLARCCSAEAFGAYVEASKRLACDKEHARFHRDVLLPIAQQLGDTSHRVLKETLRTQLPNAHMCGRKDPVTGELACMFGPVMHTNCSNLAAHDGERIGGSGARVSNRCACCGWFAQDISEWPRWDGELRHTDGRSMVGTYLDDETVAARLGAGAGVECEQQAAHVRALLAKPGDNHAGVQRRASGLLRMPQR